jgi:hypothetical protein
MSRRKSFEERAREEVERIKAQEAAEEERKQERMRELAEEARQHREAQAAEERKREEEERTKRAVFNSWVANGGAPGEFEAAWPELRAEMLKRRTIEQDSQARQQQRSSGVSRI